MPFIESGSFDDPVCNNGGGCDSVYYGANVTNSQHVQLAREIGGASTQVSPSDKAGRATQNGAGGGAGAETQYFQTVLDFPPARE